MAQPPNIDPKADAKWQKIGARIEDARDQLHPSSHSSATETGRQSNMAWRILIDVSAAPVLGLLIGYALDQWLQTGPWMVLLGLFLGLGGGFWNGYRSATGMGAQAGFKKKS